MLDIIKFEVKKKDFIIIVNKYTCTNKSIKNKIKNTHNFTNQKILMSRHQLNAG